MARVKKQAEVIAIADWPQADNLLKAIGDMQLDITAAEKKAKAEIDAAKERLANEAEPRKAAIDTYIRSLEAFAAAHQDDFGGARSRKLNFGILGWRKSTAIIIKKKAATIQKIKEIFRAKASAFLRIKEEPDKESMAKLTDEQLKVVGARRENTDVFFVEPAIPAAAER